MSASVLLALVILVIGLTISSYDLYHNNRLTNNVKQAIAAANKGVANGIPATKPISRSAVDNYHVPPTQPKYIIIPKLNVKAIVLALGTTSSNQIQAPPNVFETGWYDRSSLPGQAGAMLIDGHVSSWTSHGVFYGLKKLVTGDEIQIVRGDGVVFNYYVVKDQIYNSTDVDMTAVLTPLDPQRPGLNLITCDGSVITGTNEFNERIVVFAEQG
jgi:LPXTG-site transpeptidase (sortase) family protein